MLCYNHFNNTYLNVIFFYWILILLIILFYLFNVNLCELLDFILFY